ncbi:MAG: hypothetical protein Q4D52_00275 [Eubacteriales bacterium]|nr:hypothetical protein [Eubacteriales bacterium]
MNEEGTMGYCVYSRTEDFLSAMRRRQMKNLRITGLVALGLFPILAFIGLIVVWWKAYGRAIYLMTMAVVAILFLIILLVTAVKTVRSIGQLKKESSDCHLIKKKKYTADDNNGTSRTQYLLVLETDEGRRIRVKNQKAKPYFSLLETGDRLRYHPGFVYPIEVYDRAKAGANVCVFCGYKNTVEESSCSRCHSRLLRG